MSVLNVLDFNLLYFKLGYSHAIYFKVPKGLKVFCLKSNKLFIIGNSYLFVTQIAALIRSYKAPEPYKGKGILYASEKVVLKEGKKEHEDLDFGKHVIPMMLEQGDRVFAYNFIAKRIWKKQ